MKENSVFLKPEYVSVCLIITHIIFTKVPSSSALGVNYEPEEWCYRDPDCDPESELWPGVYQTGTMQSPIDLWTPPYQSLRYSAEAVFQHLPLENLKADHYFILNNGHTVNLVFSPSMYHSCDDYVIRHNSFLNSYQRHSYKFGNVHFHWGKTNLEGSEHTVRGKSYSMEMHLVHYSDGYTSVGPIEQWNLEIQTH
jgi:carbonic anhydrase